MTIKFKINKNIIDYQSAIKQMDKIVDDVINGGDETVWFLEHKDVYTGGTSSSKSEIINLNNIPFFNTGRGGKITYHGPGQRICYPILDLKKRQKKPDLRKYIFDLEQWIINSLAKFNIESDRRKDRIGVWVIDKNGKEKKIAAIGVRVRKWVSFHGIAINVDPDLKKFNNIIPCGIKDYGVTSIKELGYKISIKQVDEVLKNEFFI